MGRLSLTPELIDNNYVFQDGFKVSAETIRYKLSVNTRLSNIEKSMLEKAAGETLEVSCAKQMHEEYMKKKKGEEEKARAIKAQREAERRSSINRVRTLFDEGHIHIFKEGKLIEELPYDDDMMERIGKQIWNFHPAASGHWDIVLPSAVIIDNKKYPGYIGFIDRLAFGFKDEPSKMWFEQ